MERALLGLVAGLALALRLWHLDRNGWGADYYSAAVGSMATSWHNFVYCAFDPAGFISVDKPPVALWIQVASLKLFGYRPASLLVPEAIEGVLCVLLLYRLVRKRFGAAAALAAALFLALTPVLVAVNRTNNVDSALVLALLLAAWALIAAAESGRLVLFVLSMALVGVAFGVKMLAAFVVVPAFVAVYAATAPRGWRYRVAALAAGGVAVAVVCAAWILLSELTPPEQRPWVGSSPTNSMLQLTLGHNALARFVGPDRTDHAREALLAEPPSDPAPGVALRRLFVHEPPGLLRLARDRLAAQSAWWLPLALLALVLAARGGALRPPIDNAGRSLLLWAAWAATCWLVYGYAGGIFHYYYLAALAPALAALAGIAWAGLSRAYREEPGHAALLLPAAIGATALWQGWVHLAGLGWTMASLADRMDDFRAQLLAASLAVALLAAAALAALRARPGIPWARSAAQGLSLAALLALPLAWCLSSVLTPGHGVLPSADLYRLDPKLRSSEDASMTGRFGRLPDTAQLVHFLAANRSGERFLLATTTTRFAAPVEIETREPVMAMGGFHGLDRAMTPEGLAREVQDGHVRFALVGDAGEPSRFLGADAALAPISDWVREHGRRVPDRLWRSRSLPRRAALYDLRPEIPVRDARDAPASGPE